MVHLRVSLRRAMVTFIGGCVCGLSCAVTAQEQQNSGVPSDWSQKHVVFSAPGAAPSLVQGAAYERWFKVTRDSRYTMQQALRSGREGAVRSVADGFEKRGLARFGGDPGDNQGSEQDFPGGALPSGLAHALIAPPRGFDLDLRHRGDVQPHSDTDRFQKDWSENLGSNATVGMGHFPATFTSASASCSADFAVYNTSLAGSSSQASLVAFNHLYRACSPRPTVDWAYDTGGAIITSVVLSVDGTQAAFVQTDNVTGHADFVVLKWAASSGTVSSPVVLSSNSSYPGCTAPCMIVVSLSSGVADTNSSPFVDYVDGVAYVGDDSGKLHKLTHIFSTGTPAEAGGSWPVTLNASTQAALSSPVYDSVSGKIFVGDYLSGSSSSCQPGVVTLEGQCGYLYSVVASSSAVTKSAQLDYNLGIHDGPLVDSSAGMVYAFAGADNSTSCSNGPCAGVFQLPVAFVAGAAGTEATVGAGYEYLLSGAFDNQYFTSGNSPTGHLYVVGGTGPQNNTLYEITITNNVMTAGSAVAGPVVATNYTNGYYASGLPVTEFCNNGSSDCTATLGTDYIFLGVLAFGSQFTTNPCPNQSVSVGCVMGFTAPTSGVVASSATPNGTLQEAGGPSGIVVDNGGAGASNIYVSTLLSQSCTTSGGTGGCAISATQQALQ